MAAKWNPNQWKQTCNSRILSFGRHRSRSSVFLRTALLLLLSLPAIAEPLQQDMTFKVQPSFSGSSLKDENTVGNLENVDGSKDSDGFSADSEATNPIKLLKLLSESRDRPISGRTTVNSKRKWINNEYLRVWGKRDGRKKSTDISYVNGPSEDELESEQMNKGSALTFFGMKDSDSTGFGNDNGKIALSEIVDPLSDVGESTSGNTKVLWKSDRRVNTGLPGEDTKLDRLNEKRKWERNTLRIWGKRDGAPDDAAEVNERSMYTNMRRRKWENLPLRVWGK